jgi:hypothetical protein
MLGGGMKPTLGQKYLITTSNWFYGNDGQLYQAVYGTVLSILTDAETLGIKTNAKSTNWYVVVGNEDINLTIAGCQIYYALKTNNIDIKPVVLDNWYEGKLHLGEATKRIYVIEDNK